MNRFPTPLLALLLTSAVSAADWPQWRGPDRDGISKETGLLKTWPAAGPPLVWTNAEIGIGYSAPAVVGDRLFITGADDATEHLFALDVKTGKPIWSVPLGPRFKNDYGDGPRATPTVNGGRVYAVSGDGSLVCVEAADGKKVWSADMRKDLGATLASLFYDWGFTEGLLIDGDKLVCSPGGPKGLLAALDKNTGKVLWRSTAVADSASYVSPMPVDVGGKRQYVTVTGLGSVVGIAAEDGKLLWSVKPEVPRGPFVYCSTPIINGTDVYVTCGYGVGCARLHLSDGKAETVYAVKDMSNHHGAVVLLDGRLYGYSENKGWVCQDWKTGATLWREKEKLGKGCLIAADGRLYCRAEKGGAIVLLEPDPAAWREAGRFTLPKLSGKRKPRGGNWTHPVVADGKLYLRDQELLYCFDVKQP